LLRDKEEVWKDIPSGLSDVTGKVTSAMVFDEMEFCADSKIKVDLK